MLLEAASLPLESDHLVLRILVLVLISCVNLGKLLNLSEPYFPRRESVECGNNPFELLRV